MQRADTEIDAIIAIPDDQRTFDNTVGAIDDMMARLDEASGLAIFMAYVHPDAAIREAAEDGEQMWSDWSIDFATTNVELYNAVKAYRRHQSAT